MSRLVSRTGSSKNYFLECHKVSYQVQPCLKFLLNNFLLSTANLHNFADNNTISAFSADLQELTKNLENALECVMKWSTDNRMIINPGKFLSITIKRSNSIEFLESVKLVGIETDKHLNFESHVSQICKKSAGQLNALFH